MTSAAISSTWRFQGSNVPVPPDVAATLAARAAPRLEPLPSENG